MLTQAPNRWTGQNRVGTRVLVMVRRALRAKRRDLPLVIFNGVRDTFGGSLLTLQLVAKFEGSSVGDVER